MKQKHKIKNKLSKNIINYINSDIKLKSIFNHSLRKYKIKFLLEYVIKILYTGLSFRKVIEYSRSNIHWNTIYKFFIKLQKYNVISLSYKQTVKRYIKKYVNKDSNIFLTDTTLIQNKLGIDNTGYTPQLLKHKTSKISLITDDIGIPIIATIFPSNTNDSKIFDIQFNEFTENHILLLNNKNIMLGDAGYDSQKLRNKLLNTNFGKLLTPKNKRNIKNKDILLNLKLSPDDKKLLKKRIRIEHTNSHLKQYKRLSLRYDKYSINYQVFIHLACIDLITKRTNIK